MIFAESGCVAEAAAVDIANDGAVEDIDGGCVAAVGVDIALGRAAVEVAVEGAHVEFNFDIAEDTGEVTVTAAEDAFGSGGGATDGAAVDTDVDIASDGAAVVAAAVDTAVDNGIVTDGDGGAGHAGVADAVATAEDRGGDMGGAVNGDYGAGRRSIGLVAAAVDIADSASGDGDYNIIRRGTIDIVAAEDIAGDGAVVDSDSDGAGDIGTDGGVAVPGNLTLAAAVEVFGYSAAVEGDSGATVADVGQSTAAVDIVLDGAVVDGDGGGARHVGLVAAAVNIADTAVDIAHIDRGAAVNLGLFAAAIDVARYESLVAGVIVADVDHGVGGDGGCGTEAAAVDVMRDGVVGG